MTDRALFTPYDLAGLPLPNRCVMAPMVRARATPGGGVPDDAVALYYTQRAGAGLIVAEALAVSPGGANYFRASGLHTAAQRAGWRRVVRSVHAAGGRIFAQINHAGRATHVANLPDGMVPVGPSDVPAATRTLTCTGFRRMSPPRALTLSEIAGIVDDFRAAAVAALDAGFDGVEIHAANGYLIDQFLKGSANRRGDRYGGSVANRIRFLLEVVDAVIDACPGARIGLRLAPGPAQDAVDAAPQALFAAALAELARRRLAYVHMVEGTASGMRAAEGVDYSALRRLARTAWIVNNGYDAARAETAIRQGHADLVSFGRPFIANPDLVARLRAGAPLAPVRNALIFDGGAEGFTDYPPLAQDRLPA